MDSAADEDPPPHDTSHQGHMGVADERWRERPQWSLQLHAAALDAIHAQVAIIDEHGTVISANRAWEATTSALYGRSVAVGDNYLAMCETAARADLRAAGLGRAMRQMLRGELGSFAAEHPARVGGEDRWFSLRASLLSTRGPPRIVIEHQDTTARLEAERAARRRSRLIDELGAAVMASHLDGTIEVWSNGAEALYGWRADEAIGRNAIDLIVAPQQREAARVNFGLLRQSGRWVAERELMRKDGTTFWAHATTVVYCDDDGRPAGIVNVAVDVTERVTAVRELRGARDYLRAVADSMGEALCTLDVGGRVQYLNLVAERTLGWTMEELRDRSLHDAVHERRPGASACPAQECPLTAAGRTGEVVQVDEDVFVRRDGSEVPVSYTSSPFEAEDGTRGLVVVFSDITERKAEQDRVRGDLEFLSQVGEIRDALDEDRFVLYAQPIVAFATGSVFSHELLIRMVKRDGSILKPSMFLGAAEDCGLIREIDRWVIRQAAQLAGDGNRVELNLSAASLGDPGLFDHFRAAMEHSTAAPEDIVVELTETGLLHDEATAASFIQRISTLGCEFALDDFGTGFGGFGYLKRLPVDYLKIDIEFVRDLRTNAASRHVVQAVVSLAEAFGQRTIAEGVEDEETLAIVSEMGVDFAQGYAIGRPKPLSESLLS